jgi:DNA-directed RNA polymerase subunit RPC12/RpoP
MAWHTERVHSGAGPTFLCDKCGWGFASELALRMHLGRVHRNDPALRCAECAFRTMLRQRMEAHAAAVHGSGAGGAAVHTCAECGWAFSSERGMKIHEARMHPKPTDLQCSECAFHTTHR